MPSVESVDFVTLTNRFLAWPFGLGQWIISLILFFFAPYTMSIFPKMVRCGYGEVHVSARDWFWVHNPFGSFHAAALTNLAEASATMAAFTAATKAGRDDGGVYMAIPSRIDMHFFIKSKGEIMAKCSISQEAIKKAAAEGTVLHATSEVFEVKGGGLGRRTCEGRFEFNVKRRERPKVN